MKKKIKILVTCSFTCRNLMYWIYLLYIRNEKLHYLRKLWHYEIILDLTTTFKWNTFYAREKLTLFFFNVKNLLFKYFPEDFRQIFLSHKKRTFDFLVRFCFCQNSTRSYNDCWRLLVLWGNLSTHWKNSAFNVSFGFLTFDTNYFGYIKKLGHPTNISLIFETQINI